MLWAVPVWFCDWYVLGSTGMLWAVPVLPRAYRYCPDHTGTAQNIPVLPRAYRSQKQTGTAQSISVLPRAYRYCPEHTGTAQVFHPPGCLKYRRILCVRLPLLGTKVVLVWSSSYSLGLVVAHQFSDLYF